MDREADRENLMQLKDTERPACQYGEAVPSIKHGVRARGPMIHVHVDIQRQKISVCMYIWIPVLMITSESRYVAVCHHNYSKALGLPPNNANTTMGPSCLGGFLDKKWRKPIPRRAKTSIGVSFMYRELKQAQAV